MKKILLAAVLSFPLCANAATSYVLVCGSGGCVADDGTTQPAGTGLNRVLWNGTPIPPTQTTRLWVADIGQALYQPTLTASSNVYGFPCGLGSLNSDCTVKTSNGTSLAADSSVQAPNIAAVQTAAKANVLSYQVSPAGSGAIQMGSGVSVLTITGSTTVATQTVLLPPSPLNGQLVRVSSQIAISLLTIQDANGNGVGTAFALTALSAGGLYQYQSTAWVRIA